MLTVRKARDQLQRQAAQKRGGGWVARASADVPTGADDKGGDAGADGLDGIVGREPSPELAAMVADEYLRLGDDLGDDSLRRVLDLPGGLHAAGDRPTAGLRHRTVGRKLELIRMALVGDEP